MSIEFEKLVDAHNYAEIKKTLDSMNAVDIAYELDDLDNELAVKIFRMLPKDSAAEVFSHLEHDLQQNIFEAISDRDIAHIMDDLFLDDAVDFIEEMPANAVKRILASVTREKRELINQFLNYPADSAGSIMTVEFVDLKSKLTVRDAFTYIRRTGLDKETIYTCYVINRDRKLLGTVSVRTLLLANLDDLIGDIMDTNIISAHTTDDQEELANQIRKYSLLAMPIVDTEERLVGIVTVDDAFDVQEEEATEDFELMAAMSPSEQPYLKTSVFTLTKNRVPWLLLLMLSATITGTIITGFENALSSLPVLVSFIPMLMSTGGNSGSQSSTLIVRGLAINEIELSDVLSIIWKEIRVAALCGSVLVVVNFARIMIVNKDFMLALTVSLTLLITVIMAKIIGSLLPLIAKKIKVDPAVMASPIIATLLDACTLLVFFTLSKAILHI